MVAVVVVIVTVAGPSATGNLGILKVCITNAFFQYPDHVPPRLF